MVAEGRVKNDPKVPHLDENLECLPHSLTAFSENYPLTHRKGPLSWCPIVWAAWHSSHFWEWTLPSFWELPTPHPSMVIVKPLCQHITPV